MATDTAWATGLLDEAAAIVEAEWIRLQQDVALWERELADLPADLPAPRPAPPRAGVTTTAARGGQANRCQPTVAGGRRGHGPRRRYGPPSGLPVTSREPARKALSDKGGDATTDDHQQATTRVSPTHDSDCRVTATDSSVRSRVCARTATRGGISKWSRAPRRCQSPGRPAGRLSGPPRRPPGLPDNSISDPPRQCAASMS